MEYTYDVLVIGGGPAGYVAERVEAFREAGATTLTVTPMAVDAPGRLRLVEQFRELC